jgi:hypothetical protein
MKQILIFSLIFLIGLTSAVYPGETIIENHTLGSDNLVYTIAGNSTPIPELDITVNLTHIKIKFPYETPSDSFDIVFIEKETEEVIKEVHVGGGGGTRTKYVDKIVNNTVYEDKIVYKDKEIEIKSDPEIIEKKVIPWWIYLPLGILLFLLLIKFNRSRKEDYEDGRKEEI